MNKKWTKCCNLSATTVRSPTVDKRTRYMYICCFYIFVVFMPRSAVPQWTKERLWDCGNRIWKHIIKWPILHGWIINYPLILMKMHFISLDSLCFCRNQLVAYENELDLVINKEGIMCTNDTRDRVSIDTSDRRSTPRSTHNRPLSPFGRHVDRYMINARPTTCDSWWSVDRLMCRAIISC